MTNKPPSITRAALDERIRSEVANLEGDDLAWWRDHRVEPFVFPRFGLAPYAVAISGGITLVFFDDRDSFGRYAREPWNEGLILYSDLAEAVRSLATRDSMGRALSEAASQLLRLGILDRGDFCTRHRAMQILGAFGPDAAVAVPRLIEIMCDEKPLGGLQESAVATLAKIGPAAAEAVPKLIVMAERDTANARGWCLKTFESIGPAAAPAVPLLVDLLLRRASVDPDPFYVPMAADALGTIGAIKALPALLQVLREMDDPDVATNIVEAIGKLGPEAAEAGPILAVLAEEHFGTNRFSENADLRNAAREALHRVEKPNPSGG